MVSGGTTEGHQTEREVGGVGIGTVRAGFLDRYARQRLANFVKRSRESQREAGGLGMTVDASIKLWCAASAAERQRARRRCLIRRQRAAVDAGAEVEIGITRLDAIRLKQAGGAGKAFDTWNKFDEANLVGSGGAGFRYLLARKFKLRVGIDVARGPDTWAYYIVFGSNWLK